jgi:16S rRNA (uracil1498-N3)-methyltransferase
MRRRFFVEQFENQRASLEGEPAHHLGRVLRAQPGQLYELSDGTSVWLGRIETVTRDRIDFSLLEQIPGYLPVLKSTLLLSVVKFDAFEWALEKATELGVTRIVPLAAARSEKALLAAAPKRADRWKKILAESSQQCRRLQLPILDPLAKPESAFDTSTDNLRILLSESPEAPVLRRVLCDSGESAVTFAIGPEGGWTDPELLSARACSFREASLGKLILRTETAVVASLAALNFALGSD